MSEENKNHDEVNKNVTISEEDLDNVINYAKNFSATLHPELQDAIDAFRKDETYENMIEFKLQVCRFLTENPVEALKDSLWDEPKKEAQKVVFDLQFDKDLHEELAEDNEE